MGLYDLHKLLLDIRSKATVRDVFLSDPEAVLQYYTLTEAELAALRAKDIYHLYKLGVSVYLLTSFAQPLGFQLMVLGDILRTGAKAERQQHL